uniref:Uncharacterized protein n=1 Tax=Callorhinchus milii TaxID=7868 RepID=A0A4W3GB91_CALMI
WRDFFFDPNCLCLFNSRPGPAPSPAPTFHSFNVLKFDKERLERKIQVCKQEQKPVPRELLDQHRELQQRLQWQKSQLERGDPVLLRAYRARLQDFLQYYTQAATRLGTEGSRVSLCPRHCTRVCARGCVCVCLCACVCACVHRRARL